MNIKLFGQKRSLNVEEAYKNTGSSHLKSTHSCHCGVTYLCNNILVVNTWCSEAGLSLKAMRASYFQRNQKKTEPKEFPSSCSIPCLQTPQLQIIVTAAALM